MVVVAVADGSKALLLFEVAGGLFAIDPAAIRQIVPLPLLAHPPGTPLLLEGFLDLAGEAIPVLHLARLLQLAAGPPDVYAHLLVLKQPGLPLALLVDRAVGLTSAPAEAFTPLERGQTFNDCAEHLLRLGEQTVPLLSVERLLLRQERARIAALQAMEQLRLQRLLEASP